MFIRKSREIAIVSSNLPNYQYEKIDYSCAPVAPHLLLFSTRVLMVISIALLVGVVLLYYGGDWLVDGVAELGYKMNWPNAITGLILVSLGTSAPELFVSVSSAVQGHGAIAAGNVFGSNIINCAVVLGVAVCVCRLKVERVIQQQLFAMALVSFLAALMIKDGHLSRLEGLVLLVTMTLTLLSACGASRASNRTASATDNPAPPLNIVPGDLNGEEAVAGAPRRTAHSIAISVVGIIALLVGAEALIWGGLSLARQLQISEAVVALTITALGTSLPEIAATIAAVRKRETAMAVGNVVGSNLFNLGLVLGLSAIVTPLTNTDTGSLTLMVFLSLTVFVAALGLKPGYYPRWTGFLLLAGYGFYATALVQST